MASVLFPKYKESALSQNPSVDVDTDKVCTACKVAKPINEYGTYAKGKSGKRYVRSRCKRCLNEANRAHFGKDGNARRYQLKNLYGITPEEVNAMYAKQGGKCAIGGEPITLKGNGCHVDHCHKTGKVRGLLCNRCNTGIGKFGDDANRLLAAAAYLISTEEM